MEFEREKYRNNGFRLLLHFSALFYLLFPFHNPRNRKVKIHICRIKANR